MKKRKIIRHAGFWICFLILFSIVMNYVSNVVRYKVREVDVVRNLYNSPEDSYDVLFCGASVLYRAVSPMQLWHDYGITSYDLATPSCTFSGSYFMLKEALRHHEVRTVVLGTYASYYEDYYGHDNEDYFRQALDDLPFDSVRFEMITDFLPKAFDDFDKIAEYAVPFLKYHSRWSSLYSADFQKQDDFLKGFGVTFESEPQEDYELNAKEEEMTAPTMEYFQKIVDLCGENDVQLILLRTPACGNQNRKMITRQNYCVSLAQSMGIKVIDMNVLKNEIGMDFASDMLDKSHVNTLGAEKITDYVGRFLTEQDAAPDRRSETAVAGQWDSDYRKYVKDLKKEQRSENKSSSVE